MGRAVSIPGNCGLGNDDVTPLSDARTDDGFISYNHTADDLLAPRLQSAVQRFAKPWYQLRAPRLFRDETVLAADPSLGDAVQAAMAASRWFVLAASPGAAVGHRAPGGPIRLGDVTNVDQGAIMAAVFSPNGRFLITGGLDDAVIVWYLSHPAEPASYGAPMLDSPTACMRRPSRHAGTCCSARTTSVRPCCGTSTRRAGQPDPARNSPTRAARGPADPRRSGT